MTVKANTLHDPENHTQADAISGSRVLGLEATKEITLDGEKLPDAPAKKRAPMMIGHATAPGDSAVISASAHHLAIVSDRLVTGSGLYQPLIEWATPEKG